MSYSETATMIISQLADKPVAYHPTLARILGSVTAGIWLAQLLYWDGKGTKHRDGWIEKTAQEMEYETALSRREQETARRICLEKGVVLHQRRGVPGRSCYKVEGQKLIALVSRWCQAAGSEVDEGPAIVSTKALSDKVQPAHCRNKAIQNGALRTYISENTPEKTSRTHADSILESHEKNLLTHPALQVFIEVTGNHRLNNIQRKAIVEVVTDIMAWKQTITDWMRRGYRTENLNDILDVYQNGWRYDAKAHTTPRRQQQSAGYNGSRRTSQRPQVGVATPEEMERARAEARKRTEERAARKAQQQVMETTRLVHQDIRV